MRCKTLFLIHKGFHQGLLCLTVQLTSLQCSPLLGHKPTGRPQVDPPDNPQSRLGKTLKTNYQNRTPQPLSVSVDATTEVKAISMALSCSWDWIKESCLPSQEMIIQELKSWDKCVISITLFWRILAAS